MGGAGEWAGKVMAAGGGNPRCAVDMVYAVVKGSDGKDDPVTAGENLVVAGGVGSEDSWKLLGPS